jgi:ATP-binding cassette subfamily B protein
VNAPSLGALAWPLAQATDALLALTLAAGFVPPTLTRQPAAPTPAIVHDRARRSDWLRELGKWLGLDVVETEESYPRVRGLFARCAPALLLVSHEGEPRLLAIGTSGARHVGVLAPGGERVRVPLQRLQTLFLTELEAPLASEVEALLTAAAVPVSRRERARSALLSDRLAHRAIVGCWLVRPSPRLSLPSALHMLRAPRQLACLLALYCAHYALLGWSWEVVARGALTGQRDEGWLWAWLLALLSAAPLQALLASRSTSLVLDVGGWLRTRMLAGILERHGDDARGEGAGALIGRVIEAGNLESLGLTVALSACFAVVDLPVAAFLLYRAGGLLALGSYGLALFVLALGARRYLRLRREWTSERLTITHDLIERMVGHKTAVVQAPQQEVRALDDRRLESYLVRSRDFDRVAVALGLLPRVWMLVAFLSLLSSTAQQEPATLAFALAGLFVGMRTLGALTLGMSQLAAARIAWTGVRSLFEGQAEPPGADPALVCAARGPESPRTLEACALTLSCPDHTRSLLADADLTIRAGDRVLLEGPSGAGKSTLAQVLAGTRAPAGGTLTLEALDLATLGRAGWARRVTLVPQFHDNHVLEGTLAFNLLLDRSWPPRPTDLTAAEEVCRELGLGPLLDTMPSGLHQVVGENGWQLSHGELTRVYAARAILADADLVVLDESIAALDPKTAESVLACARRRTRALLLIAHP